MIKSFKVLFLLIAIICSGAANKVKAQDPEFSQFYANPLYLNPAFAGTARCPRISLNYRNQWPGISGTFITTSASYDQHVESLYGGLGLIVTNDQAANTLRTTRVSGIYSYQIKINRKFLRNSIVETLKMKTLTIYLRHFTES